MKMKAATLIPSDFKVNPMIHSDPKVNPEGFGFCNSGTNLLLQKGMENRILIQASSLLPHAPALTPSWATPSTSISSYSALQPSWLSSTSTTHPLLSSSTSTTHPLLSSSTSTTHPLLSSSTSTTHPLLSSSTTHPLLSSSTSSSHLLSSTVFSSSLLSTKNTQLKRDLLSSSVCSPPSTLPLLHSTTLSATVSDPPQPEQLSVALKKRKIELDSLSSNDYTTSQIEELNEDLESEDLVEIDSGHTELPVLDLRLSDEEEKQTVDVGEVFTVPSTHSDRTVELLKEKKYVLLNVVCCSLVNKSSAPNQNDWDNKENVWTQIKDLGTQITRRDPEFILKVAVYTRQELNIRITTNFLLALAAYLPESKPHLRRYFCAAVQLPSDWLEVTRLYSTCFSSSLPACLKKALVDKFKQFSEYQLAKYNTRKLRGKHNKKKKREVKESTPEQWEKWAQMLKVESDVVKKMVEMSERPAVDKKQSEFNMKKMIKRLHIKEPAEFVMGILGKRYPSDLRAFVSSGLSGVWESERAGQRMKLKQPDTWETKLSLEGNNAAVWEKLIGLN